jgi:tetratricopeptide (TPR) repeat protein
LLLAAHLVSRSVLHVAQQDSAGRYVHTVGVIVKRALLLFMGAFVALGGVAAAGPQVSISTRDGNTYVGTVVSETDDAITLEIKRGSIAGRMTIPRSEIKGKPAERGSAVSALTASRIAAAREMDGAEARADALIAVADRLAEDGQPEPAAALYREAGEADPGRRDQVAVAEARALTAAGERIEAEQVLRKALKRNPKNSQARAAVRNLEKAFERKADELIRPGVEAFISHQPRTALRILVDACEQLPTHVLDAASERIEEETGMTLAQIMVDCRLRAECGRCDGAGIVECPTASSNANTRCRFGRRVHFGRTERVGRQRFTKWERCRTCNGLGHMSCKKCMGLGTHLTKPSAYEREELAKTLTGELKGLEERAGSLTKRVEDDKRESAVRSVAATELLNVLQDIRVTARSLSRLDATAGARGGGNLRRLARNSSKRAAAIMTALANALYVGGEQRYESAVNYDSPLNDDATLVSPAVRAMQAKQAWEVVNQARIYTLEALELDPGSAGPTRGDLKRRLALMDRFLKRTWKTYLALRAAEERWADADVDMNALLLNALGVGGGGGGGGGSSDETVKGGGSSQGGVKSSRGNANGKTSGGFNGKSRK